MCGRYATTRSAVDLSALFEAYDDSADRLVPDYNVAPTDPVPIVRISDRLGGSVLSVARWGLLPSWAKDTRGAARMINARAETVATTRAYAQSFARRRCLVPADGWYEWVRRDGGKQAYFMTPRDGEVLAFAGLWSVWRGAGDPLLSCSVVTMPALGELALVHDRMPLVLTRDRWAGWLSDDVDPAELLAPPTGKTLAGIEVRPVGRGVGDVRNDGPELVARVPAAPLGALPEDPVISALF
ncbi:SOS response-associated peptidase [Plantactinospora soyae]|uniref:Abasic site processing protein n=1 Tax=Plantactinospora soyae TaxID=1544732 RepID=A0A927R6R7_9ACTN|nr:SOS response-associated peptidase [Plantactinospora soyae]MBE1487156.1 putative SOS response-associated peptidase YedK [Plantactinospora soyae]